MYGPTWRTPEALAAQNIGKPWVDCGRRRRPRPHRWALHTATAGRGGLAAYYGCKRCGIVIRTAGDPEEVAW